MQAHKKKLFKRKENQGITLVALVVTIVILLILAGITISLLITDTNIFTTAQKAKEAMEKAEFEEKLTLIEVAVSPNKILNGTITEEDYFNELKKQELITDTTVGGDNIKELEPDEKGNNRYEVTTEDGDVFEVIIDAEGKIETEYQGKAEKLPPKIRKITVTNKSTNHIEVQITVNRLEDGKLTYLYKKDTEPESSYKELKKDTTDLVANYTGLGQNTIYNIKVIAENKNGQHELVINELTGELPKGTITQKGTTNWSNGKASIELETSETGYTLQYQINSREGVWQAYTGVIENLNHGDVVYARLYDGINGSDTAIVNIQDGTVPVVTVTKGNVTTNSIAVSVTAKDAETGMIATPSYSYYIKKHNDSNYPATATHTGTNTSYTFTGLSQTTAYDIKVTTKDKVNNMGTGTLSNITTGTIGGATAGLQTGNVTANISWENGTASVTLATTTGFQIEWQIGNITEGKWIKGTSITGLNHGSVVYARLTDGTNAGDYASVNIQDGTAPTVTVSKGSVTTNSIAVSVTSLDGQSGMPASPSYSYYIKKHSDANYSATATHTGTNTSYTFTGLSQTTVYDIKVTTKDKVNNVGTGILSNITTGTIGGATAGLQTGNITANISWGNGTASVTLATTTGFQIEWQIGNITEGKWTKGTSITGLNHGSVVYARLTDGTNVGDYASVNIQDGTAPTVTVSKGSVTTNSITVSATSSDGQSGMPASPSYSYYIKKHSDANYPATASYTGTNTSYTFSGLQQTTAHDIKVTTKDNVNNVGTGILSNITTGTVGGATGGLQSGNITANVSWSGGSATVTLATTTGLQIEWQKGGISGNWTKGTSVTGLNHGSVVYARLTDGNNVGDYASINVQDGIAPSKTIVNLNGYASGSWTKANVVQTYSSTDNETGISKYQFTTDGGISVADLDGTPWTISWDGQWNIWIRAIDNAGNIGPWSDMYTIRRDATAPTVTNYWYSAVNEGKVSLYVQATDNGCGVNRILCPTSTEVSGWSDWNWYTTVWDPSANAYRADIKASDYNKYDTHYLTHVYAYDNLENAVVLPLDANKQYIPLWSATYSHAVASGSLYNPASTSKPTILKIDDTADQGINCNLFYNKPIHVGDKISVTYMYQRSNNSYYFDFVVNGTPTNGTYGPSSGLNPANAGKTLTFNKEVTAEANSCVFNLLKTDAPRAGYYITLYIYDISINGQKVL